VSAVSDLGSPADIEVTKVKDVDYFTKMGVFMTPGLVIDGKVASVGKVLSVEQVKEKIKGNMAQGN
jgi:hypothetical protein